MNSPHDVIVYSLAASKMSLDGLTADFKGADWLHRVAPKASRAAWIVGHLVLSERRALTIGGAKDLPALPAPPALPAGCQSLS